MCSIFGALLERVTDKRDLDEVTRILNYIWSKSRARGRDGQGYVMRINGKTDIYTSNSKLDDLPEGPFDFTAPVEAGSTIIGNMRAEPTTEYIENKLPTDQQPYGLPSSWYIVHNGTIANDKDLRDHSIPTEIDSAAIAEVLIRSPETDYKEAFRNAIRELQGSYAILATHKDAPGCIYVATNYKPIWFIHTQYGYFFASSELFLPEEYYPIMVDPYTVNEFDLTVRTKSSLYRTHNKRALVVCSGGMDSVVAATIMKRIGYEIRLLHFQYGCRAETKELDAVINVARDLDCSYKVMPINIYDKSDSRLFDSDATVAGGEEGAEFAHEWVPARNLVMLSIATAYAEANNYSLIVLGNNLEEAGAYPDNEPEFIHKFNHMLPFAVADGKQVQVIMPVGNLMKPEIVKHGIELGAPLEHTWSCYRQGEKHCGKCGPCFMRKKAFSINGFDEVIEYEDH